MGSNHRSKPRRLRQGQRPGTPHPVPPTNRGGTRVVGHTTEKKQTEKGKETRVTTSGAPLRRPGGSRQEHYPTGALPTRLPPSSRCHPLFRVAQAPSCRKGGRCKRCVSARAAGPSRRRCERLPHVGAQDRAPAWVTSANKEADRQARGGRAAKTLGALKYARRQSEKETKP